MLIIFFKKKIQGAFLTKMNKIEGMVTIDF